MAAACTRPAAPCRTGLRHQHFGQFIVSCEKADLRPGPSDIAIYADSEKTFEPLPAPAIPRQEVIDELFAAVAEGKPAVHSGEWARATTAVCLALLESAQSGRDCTRGTKSVTMSVHEQRHAKHHPPLA
jgi:phthalate 4,5-cis-dihydrodiol dehydrogenase